MDRYLAGARAIASPLLMHVGEEDEYIPKPAREAVMEALKDNKSAEVFTYPGCGHAFAQCGGAHYDKAAALANARTAKFLQLNLM
jgi:carboxymethylenebutenolidase